MRSEQEWANTPTIIVFTMATPDQAKRERQRDAIVASLYMQAAQQAIDEGKQVIGDDYRVQILPMRTSPLLPDAYVVTEPGKETHVRILVERPILAVAL